MRLLSPVALILSFLLASPGLLALEHVVRRGETLGDIAARYDVTVEELVRANQIRDKNRVYAGQKLMIPGEEVQPVREITYRVGRGETLSEIAAEHGLSARELQRHNGLRNVNRIQAGQYLRIPIRGEGDHPSLSGPLRAELDRIRPSGRWRSVVIHHSATDRGSAEGMDRYHREERRMANGLAYHFVIGNGRGMGDGEIAIGDRWRQQLDGGHTAIDTANRTGIGICLIGNFEKNRPSAAQMQSLEALVRYLQDRCHIPLDRVTTHKHVHPGHTVCPGKLFPEAALRQALAR